MSIWQITTETMSENEKQKAIKEHNEKTKNNNPCQHKNVVEELSGGRRDRCLDCGKVWG